VLGPDSAEVVVLLNGDVDEAGGVVVVVPAAAVLFELVGPEVLVGVVEADVVGVHPVEETSVDGTLVVGQGAAEAGLGAVVGGLSVGPEAVHVEVVALVVAEVLLGAGLELAH